MPKLADIAFERLGRLWWYRCRKVISKGLPTRDYCVRISAPQVITVTSVVWGYTMMTFAVTGNQIRCVVAMNWLLEHGAQ
ncbi:hypothetical protein OG21DRAFT_1515950 [Imleria badia]|nr:hypothetical protein OG21DRAFT_1515950 [Imleria badia]